MYLCGYKGEVQFIVLLYLYIDYVQEYTAQSGVEWQTKPECYICCSYITVRVGSEAIGKLNCNCPLKPFIS